MKTKVHICTIIFKKYYIKEEQSSIVLFYGRTNLLVCKLQSQVSPFEIVAIVLLNSWFLQYLFNVSFVDLRKLGGFALWTIADKFKWLNCRPNFLGSANGATISWGMCLLLHEEVQESDAEALRPEVPPSDAGTSATPTETTPGTTPTETANATPASGTPVVTPAETPAATPTPAQTPQSSKTNLPPKT